MYVCPCLRIGVNEQQVIKLVVAVIELLLFFIFVRSLWLILAPLLQYYQIYKATIISIQGKYTAEQTKEFYQRL